MLIQGSVIEITFDKVVSKLPEAIGGSTNEGYGRILVNPEFLNASFVDTDDIDEKNVKPEASSNLVHSNVLTLLKQEPFTELQERQLSALYLVQI